MVRVVGFLCLAVCAHSQGSIQPVRDLLHRVIGEEAADQFVISVDKLEGRCESPFGECVELRDGDNGKIEVRGTGVNSLAFGVGTYLRERCSATLTSNVTGGLNVRRCTKLPLPAVAGAAKVYSRSMRWTYYQNVVDSSYSFVWYDEDRWTQEIDWMALNGVNIGLVYTGQERILRDTYADFGINLTNTSGDDDFFNGPAFLSWSRGQGQSGTGGLDKFTGQNVGALPAWWFDQQVRLGQRQAQQMRALGITTILRGFEGNVPAQLKTLYPDAKITRASSSNFLLDALDPLFAELADNYMDKLITTFGTDHYYQADGLFSDHSGPWAEAVQEPPADLEAGDWPDPDANAAAHAAAAYAGLARTDPQAVWVYQSWIWRNYGDDKRAFVRGWISSIPEGHGLFLDQTAEWTPIWKKFSNWGFLGVPFIWCAMSNMGGNVGLFGDLSVLATGPLEAQSIANSSFAGVGIDPEGVDSNPAYFHFLLLSAWQSSGRPAPVEISAPAAEASQCPQSHPFAYRPESNFDYCCSTGADCHGSESANSNAKRCDRSDCCKDGNYVACASPPCMDYNAAKGGSCPISHPFVYRPSDGFDYCCASGDDRDGHVGINANEVLCDRADTCKDNSYQPCGSPPCEDYHGPSPPNVSSWIEKWADLRCGKESEKARQAWALLAETVYKHDSAQIYEHHTGYCPTTMPNGAGWDKTHNSELASFYAADTLYHAWGHLIDASDECDMSAGFAFDLVDVGREYLSVQPCWTAYHSLVNANTPAEVRAGNASVTEFFKDLDALLSGSDGFLLGRWIRDARALATSAGAPEHEDFMEWNARSQVTSWYPSSDCSGGKANLDGLWDYANKAWSGLVSGYYDRRLQIFAEQKMAEFQNATSSSWTSAMMKFACEFQHDRTQSLPAHASVDPVVIARELWTKYPPASLLLFV